MKKYIYTSLFFGLLMTVFSCNNSEDQAVQTETEIINVAVAQGASEGHKSYVSLSGNIVALNSAKLSTRVMGHVERVMVNIGDEVKKGQQLVALNNADLQAKKAQVSAGITEAEAAFMNAEKDYDRFKTLFQQNSASQKELDDITAHYNMAKARLLAAQEMKNEVEAQFAYTNVIAPFDGVITAKFIDQGDLASPGMPLIAIESPNEFEVMARVPENVISKINKGLKATIIVPSVNASIPAVVSKLSTSSSFSGGQYLVKLSLDESREQLRSGMFVSVDFPSVKNANAVEAQTVLIPSAIIIDRGGLHGIYTVSQQNTAVLRWLRLGRQFGDQVEVLSGLSADEPYIVSADSKLYNGAALNIQ